ncbi:hypothetical protein V2A60_002195 [Cordyceps javanica]
MPVIMPAAQGSGTNDIRVRAMGSHGEKQFSIQPIKDKVEPELAAHKAHGPAVVQNLPAQEGTKEDRAERKAELNK